MVVFFTSTYGYRFWLTLAIVGFGRVGLYHHRVGKYEGGVRLFALYLWRHVFGFSYTCGRLMYEGHCFFLNCSVATYYVALQIDVGCGRLFANGSSYHERVGDYYNLTSATLLVGGQSGFSRFGLLV